jgi:hypothetical protein
MKKVQSQFTMLVLEVCICGHTMVSVLVVIILFCFLIVFGGTGFTEMVQYILNFAANKDGCIVRMLNTVDSEGDTVNL